MKSKIFWILLIPITSTIVLLIITSIGSKREQFVSPLGKILSVTQSTPKTFKFDSSTDLKQELEIINPQVLDSDFLP